MSTPVDVRPGLLDAPDDRQPATAHPDRLLAEIAVSGLTGRGGAGFPVARKLAAARAARGVPVVVGNGAEGEPASGKDRALLTARPHLVLDGLALAAAACGADRGYLAVAPDLVPVVLAALATRADRAPAEVVATDGGFLSGEETALVARLEGRPAVPRDKARRLVEAGLRGRPTVVQNVETLARLAVVARAGAAAFRAAGTPAESGAMLVTISGAVAAPGVREVAHGTPLPEVLAAAGEWVPGPVLVGGFHGAWLGADDVEAADLSRASLHRFGASPGAGVLVVAAPDECGLAATARITGWLAGQSARQCGPCRNGLPRMADTLGRLAAGERDPLLPGEIHRLTALVAGRGACHHPDGTVRLVRSALRVFAADVQAHLSGHCDVRQGR